MATRDEFKPAANTSQVRRSALDFALGRLVDLGVFKRADKPVNLSAFAAEPAKVLDRCCQAAQVIKGRNDLYVLLTAEQLISLVASAQLPRSLADTLADIPVPPELNLGSLHVPGPSTEQYSLPSAAEEANVCSAGSMPGLEQD